MPIPANQILLGEVHMKGASTAGGSSIKNFDFTFHWRRTSTVNVPSKTALETAFQANIAVPICAALNDRYTQSMNTVRWVNDALDQPVEVSRAVQGSIAGAAMAVACSLYFTMGTGLRGKPYRGAKHYGPFSESDTTLASDDIWNAAALARFATIANAMLAGFTDANGNVWVPSVFSRSMSQAEFNPTVLTYNDITTIKVNKTVRWMKRRQVASVY